MRRLLFIFMIVLIPAAAAMAVEPDEILADPALETRARDLSAGFRCLVCQNQSIDDSDAPLARDLRLLIRERIKAGEVRRRGETLCRLALWRFRAPETADRKPHPAALGRPHSSCSCQDFCSWRAPPPGLFPRTPLTEEERRRLEDLLGGMDARRPPKSSTRPQDITKLSSS